MTERLFKQLEIGEGPKELGRFIQYEYMQYTTSLSPERSRGHKKYMDEEIVKKRC
jgi:hypothetical protein